MFLHKHFHTLDACNKIWKKYHIIDVSVTIKRSPDVSADMLEYKHVHVTHRMLHIYGVRNVNMLYVYRKRNAGLHTCGYLAVELYINSSCNA